MAGDRFSPRTLLYALVPSFAVLATWLSGFLQTSPMEYGFPFPWRTLVLGPWNCPRGPLEVDCLLTLGATYNWTFFTADAIFYLAPSWALVVLGQSVLGRRFPARTPSLPARETDSKTADQKLMILFLFSVIAIIVWAVSLLITTMPSLQQ